MACRPDALQSAAAPHRPKTGALRPISAAHGSPQLHELRQQLWRRQLHFPRWRTGSRVHCGGRRMGHGARGRKASACMRTWLFAHPRARLCVLARREHALLPFRSGRRHGCLARQACRHEQALVGERRVRPRTHCDGRCLPPCAFSLAGRPAPRVA